MATTSRKPWKHAVKSYLLETMRHSEEGGEWKRFLQSCFTTASFPLAGGVQGLEPLSFYTVM